MNRKLLGLCVGAGLAGLAGHSIAAPFVTFDPRSMAMGGAGVAVTDFNNAPFFNPALMAHAGEDDDFNVAFPVIGGRFFDQDDLIDVVDEDAENVINALENARDVIDGSLQNIVVPGIGTLTLPTSASLFSASNAADRVNDLLANIDSRAILIEAGAGMVVGIPSKRFGMALTLNGWSATSGLGDYSDADQALFNSIISDTQIAASRLESLEGGGIPPGVTPLTPCAGLANLNDTCTQLSFTENDVSSEIRARGIAVGELGLTIAREFQFGPVPVSIGITPKLVSVSTFDFVGNVNTAEVNDFEDSANDDSNFNLDVGLAHKFAEGWQAGLVIKNLLSQEYEAPPQPGQAPFTVELEPQARAGVSYQNEWLLAAADLDLGENSGVGFGSDTQYLSMGLELDAFDWAQFRLGYRSDLANDERDPTFSIGGGLSPFGSFHFDLAFTADDFSDPSEVGFALQFAMTF